MKATDTNIDEMISRFCCAMKAMESIGKDEPVYVDSAEYTEAWRELWTSFDALLQARFPDVAFSMFDRFFSIYAYATIADRVVTVRASDHNRICRWPTSPDANLTSTNKAEIEMQLNLVAEEIESMRARLTA
jgi:hypothetical protein